MKFLKTTCQVGLFFNIHRSISKAFGEHITPTNHLRRNPGLTKLPVLQVYVFMFSNSNDMRKNIVEN